MEGRKTVKVANVKFLEKLKKPNALIGQYFRPLKNRELNDTFSRL